MVNSQKLKFNKKKFLSNLLENQWDKEIKKGRGYSDDRYKWVQYLRSIYNNKHKLYNIKERNEALSRAKFMEKLMSY